MIINFLIQLSESDKRVLIALCLVLIILIILFGYLVKLIKYILGKKADYGRTVIWKHACLCSYLTYIFPARWWLRSVCPRTSLRFSSCMYACVRVTLLYLQYAMSKVVP